MLNCHLCSRKNLCDYGMQLMDGPTLSLRVGVCFDELSRCKNSISKLCLLAICHFSLQMYDEDETDVDPTVGIKVICDCQLLVAVHSLSCYCLHCLPSVHLLLFSIYLPLTLIVLSYTL